MTVAGTTARAPSETGSRLRSSFVGWKAWLAAFGGLLFLFSSRYQRWCWWATIMIVVGLSVLALFHVYFLLFFRPSGIL